MVTLAFLLPVVGVVVYSSFHVSDWECEVCIDFEGGHACRKVTGKTKMEVLRSATDNACALLASGVTDSMRCARTTPTKAECRRLSGEPPGEPPGESSGRPTLGPG